MRYKPKVNKLLQNNKPLSFMTGNQDISSREASLDDFTELSNRSSVGPLPEKLTPKNKQESLDLYFEYQKQTNAPIYTSYSKLDELSLISVGFASPSRIRKWAEKTLPNGKVVGEVTNANTLHYKTLKPVKGGLFCERVFGPLKDFECACSNKMGKKILKYKKAQKAEAAQPKMQSEGSEVRSNSQEILSKILENKVLIQNKNGFKMGRSPILSSLNPQSFLGAGASKQSELIKNYKRFFCPECDVEYTWSVMRRYQLGYIKLNAPVTHVWYVKGNPSYISLLLDMKRKDVENIAYCNQNLTLENALKFSPDTFSSLNDIAAETRASQLYAAWEKVATPFLTTTNTLTSDTVAGGNLKPINVPPARWSQGSLMVQNSSRPSSSEKSKKYKNIYYFKDFYMAGGRPSAHKTPKKGYPKSIHDTNLKTNGNSKHFNSFLGPQLSSLKQKETVPPRSPYGAHALDHLLWGPSLAEGIPNVNMWNPSSVNQVMRSIRLRKLEKRKSDVLRLLSYIPTRYFRGAQFNFSVSGKDTQEWTNKVYKLAHSLKRKLANAERAIAEHAKAERNAAKTKLNSSKTPRNSAKTSKGPKMLPYSGTPEKLTYASLQLYDPQAYKEIFKMHMSDSGRDKSKSPLPWQQKIMGLPPVKGPLQMVLAHIPQSSLTEQGHLIVKYYTLYFRNQLQKNIEHLKPSAISTSDKPVKEVQKSLLYNKNIGQKQRQPAYKNKDTSSQKLLTKLLTVIRSSDSAELEISQARFGQLNREFHEKYNAPAALGPHVYRTQAELNQETKTRIYRKNLLDNSFFMVYTDSEMALRLIKLLSTSWAQIPDLRNTEKTAMSAGGSSTIRTNSSTSNPQRGLGELGPPFERLLNDSSTDNKSVFSARGRGGFQDGPTARYKHGHVAANSLVFGYFLEILGLIKLNEQALRLEKNSWGSSVDGKMSRRPILTKNDPALIEPQSQPLMYSVPSQDSDSLVSPPVKMGRRSILKTKLSDAGLRKKIILAAICTAKLKTQKIEGSENGDLRLAVLQNLNKNVITQSFIFEKRNIMKYFIFNNLPKNSAAPAHKPQSGLGQLGHLDKNNESSLKAPDLFQSETQIMVRQSLTSWSFNNPVKDCRATKILKKPIVQLLKRIIFLNRFFKTMGCLTMPLAMDPQLTARKADSDSSRLESSGIYDLTSRRPVETGTDKPQDPAYNAQISLEQLEPPSNLIKNTSAPSEPLQEKDNKPQGLKSFENILLKSVWGHSNAEALTQNWNKKFEYKQTKLIWGQRSPNPEGEAQAVELVDKNKIHASGVFTKLFKLTRAKSLRMAKRLTRRPRSIKPFLKAIKRTRMHKTKGWGRFNPKKNRVVNNIYCLSHRFIWEQENHWYYFALYNYGFPNLDLILPTSSMNLDETVIPAYAYRNYDFSFLNTLFSTSSRLGSRSGILTPSGGHEKPKQNLHVAYSGAGLLKTLLAEYNSSELKKMDNQNRLILYCLNKRIRKIKKCMKVHTALMKAIDNKRGYEILQILKRNARTLVILIGFEISEGKKLFKDLCKQRDILIRKMKLIRKVSLNYGRGIKHKNDTLGSMVLTTLPVLPPDLRPIVKMGTQIAASDLNRLYQRVIYRNDRLKRFLKDSITNGSYEMKYAQRLLQEAVDNLIQNGKSGVVPEKDARGRALKSLSEILKGKQGRFRQYLLGKRVDYSGRSVIVVGPKLKLHECGIPKEMALELFLPFLIKRILTDNLARTVIGAKSLIKTNKPLVWALLREILKTNPVLLNRAPTLHRLGFQAFQPKLVDGRAILLHPLVCPAFNADFDGDQMAVHVPISAEARAEAWKLMLSRNNLLSPATGEPLVLPSQDMVLGCYYLTTNSNIRTQIYEKGYGFYFDSIADVLRAYNSGMINIHAIIWLKWNPPQKIETSTHVEAPIEIRIDEFGLSTVIYPKSYTTYKYFDKGINLINTVIRTTAGKILFNTIIQQSLLSK